MKFKRLMKEATVDDPLIREKVVDAMNLLDDAGFSIDGPGGDKELAEQLYGIASQIERVLNDWPA